MIRFSKTNFIGNESGLSCKIGDIFQRDKNNFVYLGNIFDNIPEFNKKKLIRSSTPNVFSLTSKSGVIIDLKAKMNVPLKDSQARIRFANKHSAFAHLTGVVTHSLAIGYLSRRLRKYWEEQGYIRDVRKHCLVNTVLEAEKGKLLFSKCSKTSVTLSHSEGLKIENLDSLIDAKVIISSSASSIGRIDIQNISQPIVQMVRLNRNKRGRHFRYM